jgi:hypothetical protein
MRKVITVAMTFLILLNLSACDNVPLSVEVEAADYIAAAEAPDNAEIDVNSEETKLDEIEYKTIEPPEDGWTLELLSEVTYINGKNVSIPFSVSDLGEDFSYEPTYENIERQRSIGDLFYKGEELALLDFNLPVDSGYSDDLKINTFGYPPMEYELNIDKSDFVIINGISYGSEMKDVFRAFGDNYDIIDDTDIYYYKFNDSSGRICFGADMYNSDLTVGAIFITV